MVNYGSELSISKIPVPTRKYDTTGVGIGGDNMNNKRKNRGGTVRNQRVRTVAADGVYSNNHFMYAATSLVGNTVRIQTASGNVWEGVFRTFSHQFDIVLEVAAKVENPNSKNSSLMANSLAEKIIFKSSDVISISIKDVDLEYAVRDTFQTDSAISAKFNGQKNLEDRELEPWDPTSGVNGTETSLELEPGANGWDAVDMFKKNEQVYGVTSTYDQSLLGYTVQLQHTDSADYREQEAKAEQIAHEIENQPNYKARLDLENGDEEERFAAVVRPATNQDVGGIKSSGPESTPNGGKYVPPAKRKNQGSGKIIRSTPPLPPQSNNNQNMPSNKNNNLPSPMQYPTHPSPHLNNTQPASHVRDHQPPQNRENQNVYVNNSHPPLQHMPPNSQHLVQNQMSNHPPNQQPPIPRQVSQSGGGMNIPKPQLNGDAKPVPQRAQRNNYMPSQNSLPPQVQYQEQQQQQQQKSEGRNPRHKEDVKDLHKFSQEFKLSIPPPEAVVLNNQVPEQMPPPSSQPQNQRPAQQTSPPQRVTSPPQEVLEKVVTTLKKSTLNPNAKEFVLNPSAKPFTPRLTLVRSPSNPSASRPHTPQTPVPTYMPQVGGPPGQQHVPVVMGYMMPSQPQYQTQTHPQGNRLRKLPMGPMRTDMASQMQVAAATGQPLLAPGPLQPYMYQQIANSGGFPQQMQLRMYEPHQQIQYIQNPSNGPNPNQPGTPYSQNQGHPPPPQQYQQPPPQGHPQIPFMCPIIPTQPHMMPAGMHYIQQPPPQQGPIQVLLPQPHPSQQHPQAP